MVGRRPFGYFWDGPTLGVCQKYLAVKAKPLVQLDTCNGYVHEAFNWPAYISNPCMKSFYGFRPYGGSLLSNSHKSKQKGLAPAYGPRFAQVSLTPVPLRGHAVTGHPWPNTALPASMPVDPLRRTSTRPPDGAIDQDQNQKQGKSKARARARARALHLHLRYAVMPIRRLPPVLALSNCWLATIPAYRDVADRQRSNAHPLAPPLCHP